MVWRGGGGVAALILWTIKRHESYLSFTNRTDNLFFCLNKFQVQPRHVKEAFRLLNKSIIRVEQPDIHLEDDLPMAQEEITVDENTG